MHQGASLLLDSHFIKIIFSNVGGNGLLSEAAHGSVFMGMKTKLVSAVVALAMAVGIGFPAAMSASPRKKSQKTESSTTKSAYTPQEIAGWRAKVEALVDSGPNWLESRLMMHWRTRASQEFIKGEFYAGVDTAVPAATAHPMPVRGWPTLPPTGATTRAVYISPTIRSPASLWNGRRFRPQGAS